MQNNILFTSYDSDKIHLKNRIVMAPMTRSFSKEGIPGEDVANYYARRAKADVGLIITEGTVINRIASSNDPNIPHIYGEKALKGWQKVVEAVHKEGGQIYPQLWHMGVVNKIEGWSPSTNFEGPSGLLTPDVKSGDVMTEEDIEKTILAFTEAAVNAKKVGFDGIEIHGAHGYLIDQFFWEGTNKRTDKWGGKTIRERSRFAIEIIKSIRKAVGEDYPIILRLSQWKSTDYNAKNAYTPQEMEEWLLPLSEAGVDIFHCSQRRFWEPEFEGSDLNFAAWAKKITNKTAISVGSVGLSGEFLGAFRGDSSTPESLDTLLRMLYDKEFDLIAVGRALLADPEWVKKIESGKTDQLKGFSKEDLQVLL